MSEGTSNPGSNRRLAARRACLLSVRYRTEGAWHPSTALDLSAAGCRLRQGEDIAPGTAISVAFETPLRDGATAMSAEAEGAVNWCRLDGLSHSVGIHFAVAPPALADLLAIL